MKMFLIRNITIIPFHSDILNPVITSYRKQKKVGKKGQYHTTSSSLFCILKSFSFKKRGLVVNNTFGSVEASNTLFGVTKNISTVDDLMLSRQSPIGFPSETWKLEK